MPALTSRYRAPWWLPGAHSQTIVPARVLPSPRVSYRRERWDTPDGDFIDVDFVVPEPAAQGAPVLVLFHGLEGDSQSHYARVLMHACRRRGWRGLVVHFRGCSGEVNLLPRAYHSGDSDEIDWILHRVAARWPHSKRYAAGISLGGNALAKWAGERAESARIVDACATVSAPFDLMAGGLALGRGFNRVYALVFLRSMRRKAIAMEHRFPGLADIGRIVRSRSLYEFDDAFTAPVHGFDGVLDYWTRASAKPWLAGITVPILALNASNDPFVPGKSLPRADEVSGYVRLESPPNGGHVGFFSDGRGGDRWFLRERVCEFFEKGE